MIHILKKQNEKYHFYFGNLEHNLTYNRKISFYSPKKIIHKNIKNLYVSNSFSNKLEVANIIVDDQNLSTHQLYYFEEYQAPFNLMNLNIKIQENGFTLDNNNYNNSRHISIWVFKTPDQIKLYPLSVIIWPPAYHISKFIVEDLKKHYIIIKDISLNMSYNNVGKYVYGAYRDDLRCDKSNLKYKIHNFNKHPLRFRYLKILVKKPLLNRENISQTSILIKKNIRNKYKKYITNYIYDVILHVSDNQKHTKSMFELTTKFLKNI